MTLTLSMDLLLGIAIGFALSILLMNAQSLGSQVTRNPPCGCGCFVGILCLVVGVYLLVYSGYWSF